MIEFSGGAANTHLKVYQMAENCQYCGGRLKKLHPAHEVFCSERPREVEDRAEALQDLYLSGRVSATGPISEPATNQKTVTNTVTTPRLVTPKLKLTRAAKARAKRAAAKKGETSG